MWAMQGQPPFQLTLCLGFLCPKLARLILLPNPSPPQPTPVCVHTRSHMHACMRVPVRLCLHMKVRSQPQVSFLRSYLL